ncbi:hypothetical protein KY304_00120 [Candidatus Woesearchaeota archaeon]|nr:hypothetical protein [Candidatus Woesearchaeota archaeon]MBW2978501.1 hypothetical protein [Candidatus Woesearchaeota archaeon]
MIKYEKIYKGIGFFTKKRMKKTISATVDIELIKWIKKKTSKGRKYRNKSHLIEIALEKLKEEEN